MVRLKKRWNRLAGAGLLLALLLAISLPIIPASAQPPSPPGFPHSFYGTATINGGAAAAGTQIIAFVNTVQNATTAVDSQGRYGYTQPYFSVTGTDGDTITFSIGGTMAPQTAIFQAGGLTRLNLSVVTSSLSVSTGAASGIGSTTAILNGSLADMGSFTSVNVYFQYGTTPSYGSTTPIQARTTTGAFTASPTGLTPNITYYFRAVAQSGSTTASGTGLSFVTTNPALAVSTSAATGFTATGATLNGTLVDLGTNSSVNVYFQYGTTPSYGSSTPMQARTTIGAFSAAVTGLLSNTTYHFRTVAVGSTTVYGTDMSFLTPPGTLGVATGSATGIGTTSAALNGTLTGLGANPSVSVYFKYGLTTSYGSTTPQQTMTGAGPFNASISGLSASTTYHFQTVAVGSTTVTGADASFATTSSGGGTTPPHLFYGNVYINGSLATAGATVAASVSGVPAASTSTDSSGRYGYTTAFSLNGTPGGIVTFLVNGSLVPQSVTWVSGNITRLNLYSTTPTGLTVSTGSAAYINTTSASFGGNLVSLGTDTSATVSIQYGTTTAYGSSTTPQTTSSQGIFTQTASTGLVVGNTYHYQAKAVGSPSGTTVYGSDATYVHTSGGGSLAVATNTASAGDTVATLNGTLSGLGTNTSATLSFEWGTSTSYGTTVAGTPSSLSAPGTFSASLSTLTNGTTYHCRAKAVGSPSATTVYGSDVSFTPGTVPPPGDQLIGASADTAVTVLLPTGYLYLTRFQALVSGNVATLKVRSDRSANAKVAIYDDSSGQPGALRNAVNTGTPIVAGWTSISIASTPVIAGNYYWLGINYDTDIKCAVPASIRGAAPLLILWSSCPYAACTFPGEITIYQVIQNGIVVMAGYP